MYGCPARPALYQHPNPRLYLVFKSQQKRKGEVLFIDARQIGYMKDRVLRDFTADDIAKIANTLHAWQNQMATKTKPLSANPLR